MTLRRFIAALFLLLFSGICAASAFYFYDARQEENRLRAIEAVNRRRLTETEARLREQDLILERLRTDPGYVEKVIRRKLGYAKPGELIFRFDE
jgi:cell division protein FtsB